MSDTMLSKPPFANVAVEAIKKIRAQLLLYVIVETVLIIFLLLVGKRVAPGFLPFVYVLSVLVLIVAFFHFALEYMRLRMEQTVSSIPPPAVQPLADGEGGKRIFSRSDSPEFHTLIEELILKCRRMVLIGTGLNVLQRGPFASDVMNRAVKENCILEIYLADPLCPDVESRLIEEELGDIAPPVGQGGLSRGLEMLGRMWRAHNYHKSIAINLFMHYPTFALLILDNDYLVYPYGYATLGNYSPVFRFSKEREENDAVIRFLENQYLRIKKNSVDVRMVDAVRNSKEIDVNKLHPFAIYFIPPEDSELYQFGTEVLGYDIRKRQLKASPWQEYVGGAREFGFHLTICDVLYFFSETHAKSAVEEIKFLAKTFKPFDISDFLLTPGLPDENSLAVRVDDRSGRLEAMHHEIVHRVYRRAAASNYSLGLAPLERDNNTERAQMMIERYKPTGAVLGCPLPDPRITTRLWRLALLIEMFIATLPKGREKTFAFVPPEAYHITLVNRTHFVVNTVIEPMTPAENEMVRGKIVQFGEGPVTLQLHGLLLTHWGRLIVSGYPNDDRLFRLREELASAAPGLRTNLPNTAHIKIGHVLAPLDKNGSQSLRQYAARCGNHIHEHLSFNDVYTPFCRIPLRR
jgi:hypothetical protein